MLLDKLLDYVTIHSEPFATCLLSSGWRLRLPGPPGVMFHFVMQGSGILRGPDGQEFPLERFFWPWCPVVLGTPWSVASTCSRSGLLTRPPPVKASSA